MILSFLYLCDHGRLDNSCLAVSMTSCIYLEYVACLGLSLLALLFCILPELTNNSTSSEEQSNWSKRFLHLGKGSLGKDEINVRLLEGNGTIWAPLLIAVLSRIESPLTEYFFLSVALILFYALNPQKQYFNNNYIFPNILFFLQLLHRSSR